MPFLPLFIVIGIFLATSKILQPKQTSVSEKIRSNIQTGKVNTQKIRAAINRAAITELFIDSKYKKANKLSGICIVFVSIFILLNTLFDVNHKAYKIYFLISPILLYFAQIKVIEYRVRKGYYASNLYEARELIEFIEGNSDSFDDHDGNGTTRKVFNDVELSQDSAETWGNSEEWGRPV